MNRRCIPIAARLRLTIAVLAVALLTACSERAPQPAALEQREMPTVTVAAAASLAGVLAELAPLAHEQAGVRMAVNAAGSGTLAQQILHGGPADVFISADARWMDELVQRGRIDADAVVELVRNRLVLIAGPTVADAPKSLAELPASGLRIAMGDPASVPAGRYAQQALSAAGVWDAVEPQVLPAVDVRAALAYVESGAAPLGIVYATDAAGARSSRVVLRLPAELHAPIVYPAAVLRDAADAAAAARLLAFLRSEPAQRIFERRGFEPTDAAESEG